MMMLKTRLLFLFLGMFLLLACGPRVVQVPGQSVPSLEPDTLTATLDGNSTTAAESHQEEITAVRNSVYQLGLSDQIRTVQLVDGHFQQGDREDPDYISVFVTNYVALGDLNDDGQDETVALITENYGGTGSFVLLSVYHIEQGTLQFLASIFLDDRPMIQALSVEQGIILVDATVHNFNDPMCCPTLSTNRAYQLNEQNLVLREFITKTPTGQPRQITVESPTEGTDVSGIVRVIGRVSIAPFENTLVYRLFDMGGVELSAGPVMVEAPDLGAPGTFNEVIDLGNILTNTTIRIEIQDVNAADGSLFAMDSVIVQTR
jgi:hypothetical protein